MLSLSSKFFVVKKELFMKINNMNAHIRHSFLAFCVKAKIVVKEVKEPWDWYPFIGPSLLTAPIINTTTVRRVSSLTEGLCCGNMWFCYL